MEPTGKAYKKWSLLLLAGLLLSMAPQGAAEADYVRIKGTVVNVRQGPGTSHPVLFQAEQGEEFDLISTEGLWCLVRIQPHQEAWVFRKLVSIVEGTRPGSKLTEFRLPDIPSPVFQFLHHKSEKGEQSPCGA